MRHSSQCTRRDAAAQSTDRRVFKSLGQNDCPVRHPGSGHPPSLSHVFTQFPISDRWIVASELCKIRREREQQTTARLNRKSHFTRLILGNRSHSDRPCHPCNIGIGEPFGAQVVCVDVRNLHTFPPMPDEHQFELLVFSQEFFRG